MKRLLATILFASLGTMLTAEPVKALLVVQDHTDDPDFKARLSSFRSRLSTALSGDAFQVIDPNDVVGTGQNRQPAGESMPAAAANRLADELGADVLLTATINALSTTTVGSPALAKRLSATMALQAKRLDTGAAVKGVEVSVVSRNFTPEEYANNIAAAYSDLVSQLCRNAVDRFLPQVASLDLRTRPARITAAIGCNWPGANISIDGTSYGAAGTVGEPPLKISVAPGIHRLEVTYPFALPYVVPARFTEGSTFLIRLAETPEGVRRRQQDAYFGELLDRAKKAGATDDFCRTEKAKGYAKFLTSSHAKLEGMPTTLTLNNWSGLPPPPVINPVCPLEKEVSK